MTRRATRAHQSLSDPTPSAAARPGPAAVPRRRPQLGLTIAGVAVVALLAATVLLTRPSPAVVAAACATPAASTGLGAGQCAPPFTLFDLRGQRVSLAEFRGHPVLLHFWAVGCTSCAAEYPDFARAVAAYAPRGVRVLAVDAWGESPALVQQWQDGHHLPATLLIDPSQAVVRVYGVQGTPTTLFIDRTGRITARTTGALAYADFQHALTGVL